MSETRLRPRPGELWRAYDMTPFGPGAIVRLAEVVDVVDHAGRTVVRYQYVDPRQPVDDERIHDKRLDLFVDRLAAPYESETDWMRRRSAGPVRPDEETT